MGQGILDALRTYFNGSNWRIEVMGNPCSDFTYHGEFVLSGHVLGKLSVFCCLFRNDLFQSFVNVQITAIGLLNRMDELRTFVDVHYHFGKQIQYQFICLIEGMYFLY